MTLSTCRFPEWMYEVATTVDETSINVKKVWLYLYRAVDAFGKTLEFLLSPTRNAEAAKCFFLKALQSSARSASQACSMHEAETTSPLFSVPLAPQSAPRVINVAKSAAYPKAMADLKAAGILSEQVELRQVKYLNNLIEPDHRFIKCLVKPGLGFLSFKTASRTLQGYETMHMIRKGQVQGMNKGAIRDQISFIARLFGVAV